MAQLAAKCYWFSLTWRSLTAQTGWYLLWFTEDIPLILKKASTYLLPPPHTHSHTHPITSPLLPQWCPLSLAPSLSWSTLYPPVFACQHVTPGWCPSLGPLGPFWLRSSLCLSNHLGAGYKDELTTEGQPVPHNHHPYSPLHRLAVDSSPWQWGRNLFSLMCLLPASFMPRHRHHSPPWLSIQWKGSWRESHGQEMSRLHPTK